MSFPAAAAPAILDTVLGHIAPHFLASTNGDLPTARHTASRLLDAYNAETEEELHLAAEIVSFGLHALEALGQAASPGLSLNRILRLRGSAVSLSREAHKAQRKLDQLQRTRQAARTQTQPQRRPAPPAPIEPETKAPTPAEPATAAKPTDDDPAAVLLDRARRAVQPGSAKGIQAWTTSSQQRRAAARITENLKRNQAEQARREASRTAPQQAEGASRHAAV